MILTIFTPLYNRAPLLKRVYESLVAQNDLNIEWIIVDDGSADHPMEMLSTFIEEAPFEIVFKRQKNSGKHIAINKGVKLAKGDYFIILDSDDFLPNNALAILRSYIKIIDLDKSIGGVVGRKMSPTKEIVGNHFNGTIISNSLDIRFKHQIKGDLMEVFRTSVFRKHLFPEIENEKFCPEDLVWKRIAQQYDLLFFDEAIYICEYLEGGLSDKIVKIRMDSPIASMMTYAELATYKIPFIQKIKASINFWRFAFNSKTNFKAKTNYLEQQWSILFLPMGYLMYLNDKRVNK